MKKFMSRGWFTCVFVCLSCFLISEKLSAEVNGGDEVRTVTLNMWNVSLKEILTEIEKQYPSLLFPTIIGSLPY